MYFYCNFDWKNEMINPIFGRRGPSTFQEDSTQPSPLILQDPFGPCNLGRRISTSSFSRIKDEFERASDICSEGSSPGKIFELWVPPAAGSAEHWEIGWQYPLEQTRLLFPVKFRIHVKKVRAGSTILSAFITTNPRWFAKSRCKDLGTGR